MIVKRGGTYGVSLYDSALKRKRWVGTFRTLGEARDAERAASRRRGVGRLTCGEFSELWLTDYARAAGATRRTYRYGVAAFVDEFGHVRLSEFDRLTARSWALRVPQSNVRIVCAMFTDAINDQLHPGPNPFSNLRLEQSRGRKDLTALTVAELTALGEKARDVHGEFGTTFRAMVVFAAYVGLRPGELFALERGDVGRDEVTIRQNLDGTGTIKAPKNGRERIVVLPPPAREALADAPVRLDVPWQFVTPHGRRFTKSSL
jgi:integrase